MAHGKSNAAIGVSLSLSLRAVATYVGIIFRKLDLRAERP